MGRWTNYDSDSYRLPPGMERIGYDSDSRRYTFRDQQGAVWQGSPGAEYGGQMRQISGPTREGENEDEPIRLMPGRPVRTPVPDHPSNSTGHKRNSSSMSKFSDFLPASKLAAAAPLDKDKSSSAVTPPLGSPGLPAAKTSPPPPQHTSRWNLLRSKSSSAVVPKMQSIVNAAVRHSKSDPSKGSKRKYQVLESRRAGTEA